MVKEIEEDADMEGDGAGSYASALIPVLPPGDYVLQVHMERFHAVGDWSYSSMLSVP